MKTRTHVLLAVLSAIVLVTPLLAQLEQRDPLTDAESDQLREVAQEPLKRFKLLIKFATERLNTIERIKDEPNVVNRGQKLHDALEDFSRIVDELDDNIDDYTDKRVDMRKPLTEVIAAETNFQDRLNAFKEWSQNPKHTIEFKNYNYSLQDAIDSVSGSLQDARQTLEEQNLAFKKK